MNAIAAALPAILSLVAQYGPTILPAIENLFKKENVTVADIQAAFAGLQPYSAFGIPATPPLPTASAVASPSNP